jgi:hypothetical protein
MDSFKDIAYQILKEAGEPLHSKEITKIALKRGWLKTAGKTPEATMNAALVVDVNKYKKKSRFIKVGPSRFTINPVFKKESKAKSQKRVILSEQFVKDAIIKYLSANNWGHFQYEGLYSHGLDIRARHIKYPRYYLIETKGQGERRQTDEVSFIYGLGQIITRMKTSGTTRYYYGLGLPESSAKIALRRIPWQIAKKLRLILLSVNQKEEVTEYDWLSLKKIQAEYK